MKAHPNYHVAVNLGVMLLLIAGAVWSIWNWLTAGAALKVVASVFAVLAILYLGHWVVPRFTNGVVEALFGKGDSESDE